MGYGIFNLTNIGWLLFGAILYVVISKCKDGIPLSPENIQQLKDLLAMTRVYPPALITVTLLVVLRIFWTLGWHLQLELLVVLSAASYTFRQTERVKQKMVGDIHRQLTEGPDPTRILGTNLPEWVTFPSANRVQWLNTVLAGLWPSIVGATDTSLRAALEPLLDANKPSFVYGISIKSASIGSRPIVLNGVQHHVYGSSETTLDVSCSWNAEMDIRLVVSVPGPDVEVMIGDFVMRMTIRLTLGPHLSVWPCFANIAISLVTAPQIDFDIHAAKISLDAVPGLGSWLDTFIRKTLVNLLAYPNGITIPIVSGNALEMGKAAGAIGTVQVTFLRIDNLKENLRKYKKTPFYCKIAVVDSGKKRIRGQSYTGFDSPMKDVFSFTLYDNTGSLRVWLYFDVVGQDVCVGICDIPTKTLMSSSNQEVELILSKPSDPSHHRRASVYVKPEFFVFSGKMVDQWLTVPPEKSSSRCPSASYLQQVQTSGEGPPVPTDRSPAVLQPIRTTSSAGSGTLFVTVHSASNLKNLEKFTKSDPYVFLRIGDHTARSQHISNSLNPVFNFDAELLSPMPATDKLTVSLIDKNLGSADQLMATTQLAVASVLASRNDKITADFPLSPQGSVKLTLNLLQHS